MKNNLSELRFAPTPLASASVSLNTSVLYVGQAVGSAVGGQLFARDQLRGIGYVAVAFVVLAFAAVLLTRPHQRATSS